MPRCYRVLRLWLLMSLIVGVLAGVPLRLSAQEEGSGHTTGSVEESAEPVLISANNNAGAGVTLGVIGLVLTVILGVVVIAAVALGIIGLGYRAIQGDS